MYLTKIEDILVARVLFSIGAFVLLLIACFVYTGKIENEKKANLFAVLGIPFGLPIAIGSFASVLEYYTDIYGYKENSFFELYVISVILCFFTVMGFSASFWIFNRYALDLRLSKYRDMRLIALKTMLIPLIAVAVIIAIKVFSRGK